MGDGLGTLEAFLKERDLSLPYIPATLAGEIHSMGDSLYGGGEAAEALVSMLSAVTAADAGPLATSLVIGLGGRGMQSSTLLYHLAEEPLLLLIDIPWGQTYGERADEVVEATAAFASVQAIREAADSALSAGERLVVTSSGGARTSLLRQALGDKSPIARSPDWVQVNRLADVAGWLRDQT